MTERNDAETLATAKNQTEAMKLLAAEVGRLRKSGRRAWKFVLFDIALTVALTVFGYVAVHASDTARSAQETSAAAGVAARVAEQDNRNLCESSNIARAQQVDLWDYVLGLSSGKPQTAQEKTNVAAFRHHLAVIFAPRDCSNVDPGTP